MRSEGELARLHEQHAARLKEKAPTGKYKTMLAGRKSLPAYQLKDKLLRTIAKNQVVVISGATGCGKTTQVPQMLLEEWSKGGRGGSLNIVCTQPRRISAIGVASRVADEQCEKLGGDVGYQIRMERVACPRTRVLFCTTGTASCQPGHMQLHGCKDATQNYACPCY